MGGLRRFFLDPIAQATVCIAIEILIGLYFAYLYCEPEIIGRFGATLSSIGAALVIFQVATEIRNERNLESEIRIRSGMAPADLEVAERIFRERVRERTRSRLRIVIAVATIVFVGELMHGWGDIFYRALFHKIKCREGM